MFPKIGIPQNGWFILENPIKMDDFGVPLFLETSSGKLILSFSDLLFATCSIMNFQSYLEDGLPVSKWLATMVSKSYMGVSKNEGTPKWMVYNGKPY